MYCRNCGKELIGVPYYCMNCGARPLAGKSYCQNCAGPTTPLSEICVKCGAMLAGSLPPYVSPPAIKPVHPLKSKTTSILLAVFLSFFSWAYTYDKDSWKFWIGLAIWVFMLMLLAAHIGISGWLMAFAVWIWAIIDAACKPELWYQNYHRNKS